MSDWDQEANIFDAPPYPEDWPPQQRVGAYWHALHFTGMPSDTKGWVTVWKSAEREQTRRTDLRGPK